MSTTVIIGRDSPVPIIIKVVHWVRLILATMVRWMFTLYYGQHSEKLPPMRDEILKLPAIEIARRIRNKEISSMKVTEAYIKRIIDVNPYLNCFVEDRFELALKEAEKVDTLIKSGSIPIDQLESEKPFLGVPFTTKDCIGVEGLHFTAGVYSRKDIIADEDAVAIRLLKEKGAIPLGLTNVPEICMWWETYNTIYGRTNNPYNTNRIVGGSSGGEACLQAVAGSAFGIGSDIGGSIRMPSYFNGIFGHKPTRFSVSNEGQYPIPTLELHNSFLGIGPMTRHAVDLKPILKVISGDYSKVLKLDEPVDISKLKVYYQYENGALMVDSVSSEIKYVIRKAVDHLAIKTGQHQNKANIKLLQKSSAIWMALMKDETSFARLITGKDSTCNTIKEIGKNLIGRSNNTLIGLLTALADGAGHKIGSEKYRKYLKYKEDLETIFKDLLGDDGVFLYPTHPMAAPFHNEPLIRPLNFCYTSIINCLGFPATQVPMGLNKEGLPIGLQVIANHNNDRLCLAVAEELETIFGGWVNPSK